MGFVGSSILNSGVAGTTRTIFNIALGPANTEQSQALPAGTVSYLIRSRNAAELKLAFSPGASGVNYIRIPNRSSFFDGRSISNLTLYFQSPDTGDTIEIVTWS